LSKPEIAAHLIRELQVLGFKLKLVLADSLYGESGSNFIDVLYELKLPFVVAIRSNHAVWLPKGQPDSVIAGENLSGYFQMARPSKDISVRLFLASVVPLNFGRLQLTLKACPKTQHGT
jgi:hypothetical protein